MRSTNSYQSYETPSGQATGSREDFGCGVLVLGAVVGALCAGVVFCVAVEIDGRLAEQAKEREIRQRVANGEDEDDAKMHVIMEYKTMPIAVALGYLMEGGVAVIFGAGVGGIVAAVARRTRHTTRPPLLVDRTNTLPRGQRGG
jgi:hypothetical protein